MMIHIFLNILSHNLFSTHKLTISFLFNLNHQVFQMYLSSLVSPGQCSKPHLLEACKTLAILYDTCCQLNKRSKEEFAPLSEFYNEDLSLKIDFKKEYEMWGTLNETKRYCNHGLLPHCTLYFEQMYYGRLVSVENVALCCFMHAC